MITVAEQQDTLKDLLRSNPQLAIFAVEILGPPLGLRSIDESRRVSQSSS